MNAHLKFDDAVMIFDGKARRNMKWNLAQMITMASNRGDISLDQMRMKRKINEWQRSGHSQPDAARSGHKSQLCLGG